MDIVFIVFFLKIKLLFVNYDLSDLVDQGVNLFALYMNNSNNGKKSKLSPVTFSPQIFEQFYGYLYKNNFVRAID